MRVRAQAGIPRRGGDGASLLTGRQPLERARHEDAGQDDGRKRPSEILGEALAAFSRLVAFRAIKRSRSALISPHDASAINTRHPRASQRGVQQTAGHAVSSCSIPPGPS